MIYSTDTPFFDAETCMVRCHLRPHCPLLALASLVIGVVVAAPHVVAAVGVVDVAEGVLSRKALSKLLYTVR